LTFSFESKLTRRFTLFLLDQELSVIIEDVAGRQEELKLVNEDGIVIWDLWRSWYDKCVSFLPSFATRSLPED